MHYSKPPRFSPGRFAESVKKYYFLTKGGLPDCSALAVRRRRTARTFAGREVFSSPHMSPKKMIGPSLRLRAQTLRGSMTSWANRPGFHRGGLLSVFGFIAPARGSGSCRNRPRRAGSYIRCSRRCRACPSSAPGRRSRAQSAGSCCRSPDRTAHRSRRS